jgi:hypothetical protein
MNPHLYVKVGLLHGQDPRKSESWEVIGGLLSVASARDDFMPFRLKKTDARYERVLLCPLEIERDQRLDKSVDADQPQSQSKISKAMKTIKSAVSLIAFAILALAFTVPVKAQSYNLKYIGGPTANSPASTDNTTWYTTNSAVIAVTKASDVALQVDSKLQGAGTSAVIFRFAASADGASWTSSYLLVTNTANGTTLVSSTRNLTLGGIGFLRLESINNANATAVTNLFVRYAYKSP